MDKTLIGESRGDQMSRSLKALAIAATGIMYVVLLMGALVTTSGSADGCGASWPLCKGTFMPDWDYEAVIEFSHRAVSGGAGLIVIWLAVWAWRALPGRRAVGWLGAISVGTIIFQGLLGAAAVVWPQPKAVLALHFGISLVCFSAVLLLAVLIFRAEQPEESAPVDPQLRNWVWNVTLFTYAVVYMGAYVRHRGASLGCYGWPLCNGELVPSLYGEAGVSFLHRVGAALAVLMVIRLAVMARRLAAGRKDLQFGANLALALILLQVVSGAIMAVGHFNLLTQMLHSAIVTAFWGALSYLCLQVLPVSWDRTLGRSPKATRPVVTQ